MKTSKESPVTFGVMVESKMSLKDFLSREGGLWEVEGFMEFWIHQQVEFKAQCDFWV